MSNEILLNHIYHESCLDTMSKMKDNHVNLVITSPPYNMNLRIRNGQYCSRGIVKEEFSTKYNGFNDNLNIDDFYDFHKLVISELLRVSPIVFYNISIVTGSKRAFFKLIGDFADNLKEIIVWDKGVAQPAMQSGVLNRQSEFLLVFEKNVKQSISRKFNMAQFNRGTLSDTWKIKKENKNKLKSIDDINHGAIFPEELVKTILINFSQENDIVYDPFSGSGTTAYVSKLLNRQFIGSEIVKEYYDFSLKRLNSI